MNAKNRFLNFIEKLQDDLCHQLELIDGAAKFKEDIWEREGGGGGHTRVLADGAVVEKGGINRSAVHGILSDQAKKQLHTTNDNFFACGLSLVIHPKNPHAPTCHANFRYFELYDDAGEVADSWYGGGMDLTPYYLYEEDATAFHRELKTASEPFGPNVYEEFRDACDTYFYNTHRGEARGVGGLFFDYLRPSKNTPLFDAEKYTMAIGNTFAKAYYPILEKRAHLSYTDEQKHWQEIRRGRYVEFNLIHDKGTLFGLRTNGRIESILMSLPPTVRWAYDHQPEPDSEEAKLLSVLKNPISWV